MSTPPPVITMRDALGGCFFGEQRVQLFDACREIAEMHVTLIRPLKTKLDVSLLIRLMSFMVAAKLKFCTPADAFDCLWEMGEDEHPCMRCDYLFGRE